MRIFHIATAADWQAAQGSGSYTTSTRGRTLAQEGFIHASRGDQWQGVRERFYADVDEPLVLLSIDTDLLTSPVVEESVRLGAGPDSEETFPHIYGPLNAGAVVATVPLDGRPVGGESFSRLFFEELFASLWIACLVLVVCVGGTLIGLATGTDWGPIIGAGVGLVVGVLLAVVLTRRRRARIARG